MVLNAAPPRPMGPLDDPLPRSGMTAPHHGRSRSRRAFCAGGFAALGGWPGAARAFALALALCLPACTTPTIVSSLDPAVDFGAYHTYGFVERLDTDRREYGSLQSQFLKEAARAELEARGYEPAVEPDLLVNFTASTDERFYWVPAGYYRPYFGPWFRGGYYGPYYGFGTFGGGYPYARHYVERTIGIEVIDRRRQQMIWQATRTARWTSEDRDDPRAAAQRAVVELFAEYPRTADP